MDWSLALISQGIESTIDHSPENGWGLFLPETDLQRALDVIRLYRTENARRPWRQSISSDGVLFDWAALTWIAILVVFFLLSRGSTSLVSEGMMDRIAVARGEWWRLFTAVCLHADTPHLAANASVGFILLALTMGRYGSGAGLLAAFLAGAGGNVVTWIAYQQHTSLGASGMVMGCVGLLAAQGLSRRSNPKKYLLTAIGGGLMLFILLGASADQNVDVLAHLGGFLSGLLLGPLLLLVERPMRSSAADILCGTVLSLLLTISWWLALK